jgi:hypothetical protein
VLVTMIIMTTSRHHHEHSIITIITISKIMLHEVLDAPLQRQAVLSRGKCCL